MRTYKTTGIIIKRRNIGEADRYITIFTKEQGKIQIKAKGVRKITSRRSGHVELLNYGICNLYKGQGTPILTEIETINAFQGIKRDLQKSGFAYHICELIDGLCPENQELDTVFLLLLDTLERLSVEDENINIIHTFEITLLQLLGYRSSQKYISSDQTEYMIESILERKLKTLQILSQLQ